MDAAAIRDLHRKLVFPGVDPLLKAAKREAARGNQQAPSRAEVQAAIQTVPTSQVYRKQKYEGAVFATAVNERWQVDLASFESLQNVNCYKS
jgi:hypothetical protein